MRRVLALIHALIAMLGMLLIFLGVHAALSHAARPYYPSMLLIALSFTLLVPWLVRLPGNATWRPAMAIAMSSMFIVPPLATPLVAVPGLLLATALERSSWASYPLALGSAAAGLYAGAEVFSLLAPPGPMQLPQILPAAVAALLAHFVVYRLVTALRLAYQTERSWRAQLNSSIKDLNWGQLTGYLVSFLTALLYQYQGAWGFFLITAILVGLNKSAAYYTGMQLWQQAAWTDGLTGIANRTAWERFASVMQENPVPGTLGMLDLDNFKCINDQYGHPKGDELLRDIAKVLQSTMRNSDYLFRYGGDEFVFFLPHPAGSEDKICKRINHITAAIDQRLTLLKLPARASIGYASLPQDSNSFVQLVALADARMYKNKILAKSPGEITRQP